LLTDANLRIDHVKSEDKNDLPQTAVMLPQFPDEEYKRENDFDPKFILATLRYDVNNRKHTAGDLPFQILLILVNINKRNKT
jgi:hypothetical protein